MPDLWVVVLIAVAFVVYVAAKVYAYDKESKADWDKVDKSKLKKWDDDESDR